MKFFRLTPTQTYMHALANRFKGEKWDVMSIEPAHTNVHVYSALYLRLNSIIINWYELNALSGYNLIIIIYEVEKVVRGEWSRTHSLACIPIKCDSKDLCTAKTFQ